MNRTLLGLCAAVALVGAGGALAQSDATMDNPRSGDITDDNSTYRKDKAGSSAPSASDLGTDSSMQGRTASNETELTGTVVKVSGKMLWMEHMGAVVPMKIASSTRFDDPSLKRVKDLKEGQEIRASFIIQGKTTNVAKSISLADDKSGYGGSGVQDRLNDQAPLDQRGRLDDKSGVIDERDQDLDHRHMDRPMPVEPDNGTGGSGTSGMDNVGSDIDHGSGIDHGAGDIGPGTGGSGLDDDSSMDRGSSSPVPDVGSSSGNSGQTGSGSSSDQRTY